LNHYQVPTKKNLGGGGVLQLAEKNKGTLKVGESLPGKGGKGTGSLDGEDWKQRTGVVKKGMSKRGEDRKLLKKETLGKKREKGGEVGKGGKKTRGGVKPSGKGKKASNREESFEGGGGWGKKAVLERLLKSGQKKGENALRQIQNGSRGRVGEKGRASLCQKKKKGNKPRGVRKGKEKSFLENPQEQSTRGKEKGGSLEQQTGGSRGKKSENPLLAGKKKKKTIIGICSPVFSRNIIGRNDQKEGPP